MYNRSFLLILISILGFRVTAQVVFEKGYFIDESNHKITCLIRNVEWRSNPTQFEYKLSADAPPEKGTLASVREFGFDDGVRYIRASVAIDRSSEQIKKMSSQRNPEFQQEQLFLKVLIEGKASLFEYIDGNLVRLFYSVDKNEITQLVYKSYLNGQRILQNNHFRQQLFNELKCDDIGEKDVDDLDYEPKTVRRFFEAFNRCVGSSYTIHEPAPKKDLFNLTIRPGVNFSSLKMDNSASAILYTDLRNVTSFRFGLEAEYILPFNKNKWSIVIEPAYQHFQAEKVKETESVSGGVLIASVDYRSVELPIGVRHHFFLDKRMKIFVNLSYVFDIPTSGSSVDFTRENGSFLNIYEIKSRPNFAFGVGCKYRDRLGIEVRYQAAREILSDYVFWDSSYKGASLILGYTLL